VGLVTGVQWVGKSGKWRIQLYQGGQQVATGLFDDEEAAARAYDAYVFSLTHKQFHEV
jgi:hypothetical protein